MTARECTEILGGNIAHFLRHCSAIIAALVLSCGLACAQQPGRIFPYSWAGPIPADDITTADVQHALIWTGHYGAMVDGLFGGFTKRAIGGWLASKGYPPPAILLLAIKLWNLSHTLSESGMLPAGPC